MLRSQEEHPRAQKNIMKVPTNLNEPTFSSMGPIGHVNLLLDVKIISS
jgi:hypothetical protein